MRILYLILKILVNYPLRVYYPRIRIVNRKKQFLGRTIYVSNHAASFMDPLIIGGLTMPIVFFLTRSDVFNRVTRPFLWGFHMLPIYREHDGGDTQSRNKKTFEKCAKVLRHGRNLLVFGEGFTDDVFIRRLKRVKKGAARIGFLTLEELNWEKKIYIAAIGCNYSSPNKMRSDLLISTSERICLNDFKEDYLNNQNKVITEVTRLVEKMMQEQITHIEDRKNAPFHEQIMIITRKGMNPHNFDRSIPLFKRWKYSQGLAKWMNTQNFETNTNLAQLKDQSAKYFELLEESGLDDQYIHWKITKGDRTKEILKILFLFPFAIIGLVHCALPYFVAKRFVERTFGRKVFWGSVKLAAGMILIGLINIPAIFLFYHFIYPSWWLSILYFFSIGFTGLAAYMWFININYYKTKGAILKMNTEKVQAERIRLENQINTLVPNTFDD